MVSFVRIFNRVLNASYSVRFISKHVVSFTAKRFPLKRVILSKNNKGDNKEQLHNGQIITELNFMSIEDAKPFMELPTSTLLYIYRKTKTDVRNGNCKNRLYYIADRVKITPSKLSTFLAKKSFVYGLSFEWLKKSLDILLEMGITGDRLARDLWVLRYKHETIRQRLMKVKEMGIITLQPWMVRCSEDILKRYVVLSNETKHILGDNKTTKVYLAERLNTTLEAVDEMCLKVPTLNRIRVTKVKSFLDFLESEGFTVQDIASKPKVLTASQKTVQKRIDTLRKLGLKEINLNVLCRSRNHYRRYLESIESAKSIR